MCCCGHTIYHKPTCNAVEFVITCLLRYFCRPRILCQYYHHQQTMIIDLKRFLCDIESPMHGFLANKFPCMICSIIMCRRRVHK